MTSKKETFELLNLILDFYDQFEISQSRIDSWHLALKDYEFDKLKENLLSYSKENKYPPKITDLIGEKSKILDRMNAIPDVIETKRYLDSYGPIVYTEEEKASIEKSKAQIRKLLGIC